MTTIERIAMGIVGIALVTTLILPDRQTVPVVRAVGDTFSGALRAAMAR
jgi:hypothetical protein